MTDETIEPSVVLQEVQAERNRQREKGYTAAHDDSHMSGTLIHHPKWGAVFRLTRAKSVPRDEKRKLLIEAAAMIVAEIEKMDRTMTNGEAAIRGRLLSMMDWRIRELQLELEAAESEARQRALGISLHQCRGERDALLMGIETWMAWKEDNLGP
ncbi:hypothetical protein [Planktothrix phage Pra-JY27]|nr:hypothetical protein [Planktothrix phage Pag-Yong1]WEV89213.1 hypothetical protein [Synechococcus phage MinM2]